MGGFKIKTAKLIETAKALVADDKGLLAMDESNPTCNKRFAKLGIPQTEEARRAYRDLVVTTLGLGESISGAILYEETIRRQTSDGCSFIKALADAAIIVIGNGIPTRTCIEVNAHALARYAALCQEAGLVPIVEPEVLMDGDHTMQRCGDVTEGVLRMVFGQLNRQRVILEGMLLKPNMVLPGLSCPHQESVEEIADATVNCFLRTLPAAVPGIAFLSGGQSAELASARLNAMNLRFKSRMPWALAFSFSRAIQQPALEIWQGKETNVAAIAKSAVVARPVHARDKKLSFLSCYCPEFPLCLSPRWKRRF